MHVKDFKQNSDLIAYWLTKWYMVIEDNEIKTLLIV